jgi:hypothetical protein
VFLDREGLSPVAREIVRDAAHAAPAGQPIRLRGRAAYVEAVKAQLIREGVPAKVNSGEWPDEIIPSEPGRQSRQS